MPMTCNVLEFVDDPQSKFYFMEHDEFANNREVAYLMHGVLERHTLHPQYRAAPVGQYRGRWS